MIYATITGRLAVDAATKEINGKNYIRATVPQQDRKDGPTTWVDILVPAGQNPNGILDVLRKGAIVSASGDLKVKTYTTRDGAAKADVSLWSGRINIEKFVEAEPAQAPAPKQEKKDDAINKRGLVDDPDADLPF